MEEMKESSSANRGKTWHAYEAMTIGEQTVPSFAILKSASYQTPVIVNTRDKKVLRCCLESTGKSRYLSEDTTLLLGKNM
ncbi:unnamed protein product [Lupinus luteus]|uniref:Uncharacterized protein n=1 Tax=Lupinus luteus TaxID=3873 RepID=A0AAV1YE31_LUPLU